MDFFKKDFLDGFVGFVENSEKQKKYLFGNINPPVFSVLLYKFFAIRQKNHC
jgi:hypothetical protein